MNKKNWLLVALGGVALLSGATAQYLEYSSARAPAEMCFMLIGITLYFAWYYVDSEEIGYRRGMLLNVAVVALAIVALPYYFFRSRGFKKGLVYTALFLLAVIAWSALHGIGAYAVHQVLQG